MQSFQARVPGAAQRETVRCRQIKATALAELGERQVNATARNYYLTSAQFLQST